MGTGFRHEQGKSPPLGLGDAARVTWAVRSWPPPASSRRADGENRSTAQTAVPGGLQGPSSHQLCTDLEHLEAGLIWGGGSHRISNKS